MHIRWSPSVTVAAVIEKDGRFLLVEEHTPEGLSHSPYSHQGRQRLQAAVHTHLDGGLGHAGGARRFGHAQAFPRTWTWRTR